MPGSAWPSQPRCLANSLAGRTAGWMAGWWAGWLAGWLACWLACWLAGDGWFGVLGWRDFQVFRGFPKFPKKIPRFPGVSQRYTLFRSFQSVPRFLKVSRNYFTEVCNIFRVSLWFPEKPQDSPRFPKVFRRFPMVSQSSPPRFA